MIVLVREVQDSRHKKKSQGPKNWREFATILQVENGLKDCIVPSPMKSDLKKTSNGMWKSINGSLNQKLLIAEVRIFKSLEAGKIWNQRRRLNQNPKFWRVRGSGHQKACISEQDKYRK